MNRHQNLAASAGPVLAFLLAAGVPAAAAQQAAELFPQPMAVEHQLIERTGDGDVFYGEPVRDTYGGSWIVSERPDGSRLVVDLLRREITEIRPAEGSYSTIGFGRFAELRARIARHELGGAVALAPKSAAQEEAAPAELELVELQGAEARASLSLKSRTGPEALPLASQSAEIRRFEIRRKGSPEAAAEVWVDPRLRFGAEAQAALAAFETDALGGGSASPFAPARLLAEVRRQTAGALPLLTVMPLLREDGTKAGESEDRVLSAEKLAAFPAELARVPEGLTRTSHPLESILAALEAEAAIDAALAGQPAQ
jgi:hypothetical protein